MSRPLCFHPLALSSWDRIVLHADRVLGFRKDSVPAPGRPSKHGNRYGLVLEVARRFVAGDYGTQDVGAVATAAGIDHGSLKSTVSAVRAGKRGHGRKEAAA